MTCAWALLYIERWLTAPMLQEDGTMVERNRGTPQGGVVSPILANLFVHYAFDAWMARRFPDLAWCRYADDGLVHCRSEEEARTMKRWQLAWPSAVCNCIQRRRRSFTARTIGAGASTRRSVSTFSATAFALDRSGRSTRGSCSAGSPRRSASQR